MAARYKGAVEFLLVYIREAHPTDGWKHRKNEEDGIRLTAAKTFGEKEETADACVRNLGIGFTTVVDNMDNQVELEYAGWPDRLYLIGKSGRIAFKGGPGPKGFLPAELEA